MEPRFACAKTRGNSMATREIIQVEERVPFLKAIPLSLQHLFAMFGASVLVPILFNSAAKATVVDPALVLMMNGIGTLIYLFVCRGKAKGLERHRVPQVETVRVSPGEHPVVR